MSLELRAHLFAMLGALAAVSLVVVREIPVSLGNAD